MFHRKKPKVKAVFVDTLEYQGTLDTMARLAETVEMDSEVIKEIKVNLEKITSPLQHALCTKFFNMFYASVSQ